MGKLKKSHDHVTKIIVTIFILNSRRPIVQMRPNLYIFSEQAIIPDMHTSSLKQRLIKDDPDDSRLSRAKIEDYSEKHIPLIPPQDGDWVSTQNL